MREALRRKQPLGLFAQELLSTQDLLQGCLHVPAYGGGGCGLPSREGNNFSANSCSLGKPTRPASHRAAPCPRPAAAPSRRGCPLLPAGLPGRLRGRRKPAAASAGGREGFPSAGAGRGRARSPPLLPQPPRACKSSGGGGRGGGFSSPPAAGASAAPGCPAEPRGRSGRSESFCVRVPARRGLFALQQLSHYLHWL